MIPPSLYWLYGQPGVRIIFEPCGYQDLPPIFFYGAMKECKRQIQSGYTYFFRTKTTKNSNTAKTEQRATGAHLIQ